MKLGNNAKQISSLSSSKYVPNVHKCNSDCKHFWGGFLPARSARCGLARRGGGGRRRLSGSLAPAGTARAPEPRSGCVPWGVTPREPAGSPDPFQAELNQKPSQGSSSHWREVNQDRTMNRVWRQCLRKALGPKPSWLRGSPSCSRGHHDAVGRAGRLHTPTLAGTVGNAQLMSGDTKQIPDPSVHYLFRL